MGIGDGVGSERTYGSDIGLEKQLGDATIIRPIVPKAVGRASNGEEEGGLFIMERRNVVYANVGAAPPVGVGMVSVESQETAFVDGVLEWQFVFHVDPRYPMDSGMYWVPFGPK